MVFFYQRSNYVNSQSGLFVAQAQGYLQQRDYAKAQIAAAHALTFRDTDVARKLLLAARLGGIDYVARSGKDTVSDLNIFSEDGSLVAAVEHSVPGKPVAVSILTPVGNKTLWRIVLPSSAGVPDSIAFSVRKNGSRMFAAAWPADNATSFHVGVWELADGRPAGAMRELSTGSDVGRHTKRIPSMAFNPVRIPGLATASEDERLMLWDSVAAAPAADLVAGQDS